MLNMAKVKTLGAEKVFEALQDAEERTFYRMCREDDPARKALYQEADKRLRKAIVTLFNAMN